MKANISKSLVIGFGSIGQRHTALLTELKIDVTVVSRRAVDFPQVYRDLSDAVIDHQPDLIVVANETSLHMPTLQILSELEYKGIVLCEKPLAMTHFEGKKIAQSHLQTFTAYNLRFHPLIQKLKADLENDGPVLHFSAYVGQFLPDWRSLRDYRDTYSAKRAMGGGVLRDLSHEIDLCVFLMGHPIETMGMAAKVSQLEIDTEDVAQMIWRLPHGGLGSISMNYLDRKARRFIIVNTPGNTYFIDLVEGKYTRNSVVEEFSFDRNVSYRAMYQALLEGRHHHLCPLNDALFTLKQIENLEQPLQSVSFVPEKEL